MTPSESSTTQHVPKCPKMKTPKLSASKLIVTTATIAGILNFKLSERVFEI